MIRCVTYALMLASLAHSWLAPHRWRHAARRVVRLSAAENDATADAIAAADAELCAEATRVAWAELEDVRARAARPPCKAPPPNAELLRLVDKLSQSRRYIAYLKLHRTELRRLSTRTVLARRAAEVPLADLAPPLTRPTESPEARAALDELIRAAHDENTAVAWEAVEEVLARDNSVACAPSLDDEGIVEDDVINLEVELALEHLEALACRAEMSGAFSSLRRQV